MLHRVGVPKNIQVQLAGESLFNDGVGAILFLAVLEAAHGQAPSLGHISAILLSNPAAVYFWALGLPGLPPN